MYFILNLLPRTAHCSQKQIITPCLLKGRAIDFPPKCHRLGRTTQRANMVVGLLWLWRSFLKCEKITPDHVFRMHCIGLEDVTFLTESLLYKLEK